MTKRAWTWYASRAVLVVAVVVGAAALLTVRALAEGQRELRLAQSTFNTGDLEQSILHARKSATWYVPGAAHVPEAYARLLTIARTAEGRGDTRTALLAWQAIRHAALSTRTTTIIRSSELSHANVAIARLSSKLPRPSGGADRSDMDVYNQMLEQLDRQAHPHVPWVGVMLAGFGLMTAGFVHLALRGISERPVIEWGKLRVGGGLLAIGLVAWTLAWWFA